MELTLIPISLMKEQNQRPQNEQNSTQAPSLGDLLYDAARPREDQLKLIKELEKEFEQALSDLDGVDYLEK